MKRRFLLPAIGALLVAPASTGAEPTRTHHAEARVAHIEAALAALAATEPADLGHATDYARAMARGACAAGTTRLRVECLMVAADRYCRARQTASADADVKRCRLVLDVLASNVLADERLVSSERRWQILRASADHRRALAAELRRIQAALAVDFRLATGVAADRAALAKSIDRYCLAAVDETHLPYPICVASLVSFIGGPK